MRSLPDGAGCSHASEMRFACFHLRDFLFCAYFYKNAIVLVVIYLAFAGMTEVTGIDLKRYPFFVKNGIVKIEKFDPPSAVW